MNADYLIHEDPVKLSTPELIETSMILNPCVEALERCL